MPRLDNAQLYQLGCIAPMRHRRRDGEWYAPIQGRPIRLPQLPAPALMVASLGQRQEHEQEAPTADPDTDT